MWVTANRKKAVEPTETANAVETTRAGEDSKNDKNSEYPRTLV